MVATNKNPKNAGRKKGSLNKDTITKIEIMEAVELSGLSPLDFCLGIMRQDKKIVGKENFITLEAQLIAARIVMPYIHQKLPQKITVKVEGLADRLNRAKERIIDE